MSPEQAVRAAGPGPVPGVAPADARHDRVHAIGLPSRPSCLALSARRQHPGWRRRTRPAAQSDGPRAATQIPYPRGGHGLATGARQRLLPGGGEVAGVVAADAGQAPQVAVPGRRGRRALTGPPPTAGSPSILRCSQLTSARSPLKGTQTTKRGSGQERHRPARVTSSAMPVSCIAPSPTTRTSSRPLKPSPRRHRCSPPTSPGCSSSRSTARLLTTPPSAK